MEKIEKAYEIVKVLGEQYKPLEGVYYLLNDEMREPDEHIGLSYCHECCKGIAEKDGLHCVEEHCTEAEDFCICIACGGFIETSSILWTEQEMGHWLNPKIAIDIKSKCECWQLMQILHETYGAKEKLKKEVEQIAEKVLEAHKKLY